MLKLGSFTFKEVHVTHDVVNDNHPTIICDLYFDNELMMGGCIVGKEFWELFRDAVKLVNEQHRIGKVNLELLKLLLISNRDY